MKIRNTKRRGRRTTILNLSVTMGWIAPQFQGAVAEWDNTGLLVGNEDWPLNRALLTIDLTQSVLQEAMRSKCDAIVSYHPPIFKPIKSMTFWHHRTQEEFAAEALANKIAVYSPHTALDSAVGGTNDTLAKLCGLVDVEPFNTLPHPAPKSKLVVFVPETHVEKVAEAIFAEHAGMIGDYEKCSFRVEGQGTFFGGESTSPIIGKKGRLERVKEIRLEAVFSTHNLNEVVEALKKSHPYEEPAFDIYPLHPMPLQRMGPGRVGKFPKLVRVRAIAQMLKTRLRARNVLVTGNLEWTVGRAFICVGAAGSLPFEARPRTPRIGNVVITGEIRHHDALRYQREGAAAIALGHWASERPVLKPLAARLKKELPGVEFIISKADRDPFTPV